MLDKMQVREDDEDFRNEIDEIFDDLAQRKPGHFAVRQYQKYKMASGKTAKSILISCGARAGGVRYRRTAWADGV